MLKPREVEFQARKKENENLAFRTYLKIHANEEELDRQFLELHNELFKDYVSREYKRKSEVYIVKKRRRA